MTKSYKFRRSRATSAVRALDVLEHFGVLGRPLRAKEIVARFELAPSSAEQLLKTMVEAGYLVFDPQSKLYDVSFRLTTFARWLVRDCYPGAEVSRILEDLSANTGGHVFLAQRTDNFMRVVEARASDDLKFTDDASMLLPLDAMTGQAFLASCDEHDATRIVEHATLHRHLPAGASHALVESVRAVRSAGYAMGTAHSHMLQTVSMPLIFDAALPTRTLVLSVTGIKDRMRPQEGRVLALAQESSARILKTCASAATSGATLQ